MTIDEYRVLSERVKKWEDLKTDFTKINSWLNTFDKLKRQGHFFNITIQTSDPSLPVEDSELQIIGNREEFQKLVVDWLREYQAKIYDELKEL